MGQTEFTPRYWEVFFDVFEALPRQGPGNRECAGRALALCRGLPPAPAILDLGCGVGGQTLHLAELTGGAIDALDSHFPSLRRLSRTIRERGLVDRIRPVAGDMASPPYAAGSFDLIWSEGALYNIGIERALRICRPLLRPGGRIAFTDAVWRKADPPGEVRAAFEADGAELGWAAGVLATIDRCGYEGLGHFTLPDEAWWTDFYTPMEERIRALRPKYEGDAEAAQTLASMEGEIDMHRRHSACYAYEFFIARPRD